MKKHECEVCDKKIKDGDEIAILSYPVRSYGGKTYQLNDFLRCERIIHFDCLKNVKFNTVDNGVLNEVKKNLEKLGFSNIDKNRIEIIMLKLKSNDIDYIVAECIENLTQPV